MRRFGTEEQCAQAVFAARWPSGFRCPRCQRPEHDVVGHGSRKLLQCRACRHQTSLTAGSIFEHTKLPLHTWFLALYFISQAKTGLSALTLKRHLGVSYPTAWALHHKINRAMALREAAHTLSGSVQLDDAYLGGERAGGKPGRGSENKVPFVAAVSTLESVRAWAKATLTVGCSVTSDGLACFAAVVDAGCTHTPIVVGTRRPRELPQFTWTILGNLKTSLHGTYHSLGWAKHADT